jgi:dihydroflavonol-4-reductase
VRVLVTGGTGFLGRHLVTQLRSAGHEVRVLARGEGATHRGSVTDSDALRAAMEGCAVVHHLAGRVDRDRSALPALRALHVDGTRAVIDAAVEAGVHRVVYASTSGTIAVTRDVRALPDETWPYPHSLVATWPYYATKIEAEQVALAHAAERGVDLVCLNPSLLLGPGDTGGSSTTDVADLVRGRVPAVPSGTINFVDVRDVAAAFVAAAERGVPGERYLLGSANWTLRRFADEVCQLSGTRAPRLSAPDAPSRWAARLTAPVFRALGRAPALHPVTVEMAQHSWTFRSDKARDALGFQPRGPVVTLRDTIADLRSRAS